MNQIVWGRMKQGVAVVAVFAATFASASVSQAALPYYYQKPNSLVGEFTWTDTGWTEDRFDTYPSIYPLSDVEPGVTDDGLDTTITLPNFEDDLNVKLLRLIMTFDNAVDGDDVNISVMGYEPDSTSAMQVHGTDNVSILHYFDWEIRPNPAWEQIVIHGDRAAGVYPGNLNFVEIVTISLVPEPGTALLAGLGLLGLIGLRRRR
ncbi:MAG: PEP-CTERM sorting domain-containing protein [Pirellulales bacterium]